jgi:alcohol dehydrogenase (cytochrome c)
MRTALALLAGSLVAPGCSTSALDPPRREALAAIDGAALARGGADGARDWPTYGRDYSNRRYSPLRTIDTASVRRLRLRSSFRTGAGRVGSFQSSPLVVDGVMYVTSAANDVVAFDLRHGRIAWKFHPTLGPRHLCCGGSNRGVALGHGLVFIGLLDARLAALDAVRGTTRWVAQVADAGAGYSLTMAPLVVDSLVIVGTAGAEYGIRGHLSAYNVRNGRLVWRWHSIPGPDEGGWWGVWRTSLAGGGELPRDIHRERADSARYADAWEHGGGSIWTTPAYDPPSGRLFVTIGNPAPSFHADNRPGDNLYTNAIVAVDARSGRLVWHQQLIPHDVWDYDAASPPLLADLGGRRVVLHAGKIGWLYTLDAADGRLLRRSEPFVPQQNLFAVPTPAGVLVAPGPHGGAGWSPMSYSPETGLAFVVGIHRPMVITSHARPWRRGRAFYGGGTADGPESWGTISAINPADGRIVWQVRTDRPMVGGSLVTAGGLLFTGEGEGWFRAYDAATGRRLWEYRARAGVNAPPVTFTIDGEQFVAVAAGGNTQMGYALGDEVLIFGLEAAAARSEP